MSERPIVIQQTQSNTNNGCGSGCGAFLGIFILIALLATVWGAMAGEYGTGWQVLSIVGVAVIVLLVVVGLFGLAAERFGWFKEAEEPEQVSAETILEDENYGYEQPGPPARPMSEPGEKLERLRDLRDRGLISEEEFAAKREEILREL